MRGAARRAAPMERRRATLGSGIGNALLKVSDGATAPSRDEKTRSSDPIVGSDVQINPKLDDGLSIQLWTTAEGMTKAIDSADPAKVTVLVARLVRHPANSFH
jgi:hypothetical protein